jgi:hypothetical protein
VYYGDNACAAYDFSKGQMILRPEDAGDLQDSYEQRERKILAEFRKSIEDAVCAHGGAAP